MAAKTLDAIADLTLPDSFGHEVLLRDLWSKQPTVVVWLRHYG